MRVRAVRRVQHEIGDACGVSLPCGGAGGRVPPVGGQCGERRAVRARSRLRRERVPGRRVSGRRRPQTRWRRGAPQLHVNGGICGYEQPSDGRRRSGSELLSVFALLQQPLLPEVVGRQLCRGGARTAAASGWMRRRSSSRSPCSKNWGCSSLEGGQAEDVPRQAHRACGV